MSWMFPAATGNRPAPPSSVNGLTASTSRTGSLAAGSSIPPWLSRPSPKLPAPSPIALDTTLVTGDFDPPHCYGRRPARFDFAGWQWMLLSSVRLIPPPPTPMSTVLVVFCMR